MDFFGLSFLHSRSAICPSKLFCSFSFNLIMSCRKKLSLILFAPFLNTFDRVIWPFNLFSKIVFNSLCLLSFDIILSCSSDSPELLNLHSNCSIYLVYFISFLMFSFLLMTNI